MAYDARGSFNTVLQVPGTPASDMAPATATYGPSGAVVVDTGGVVGNHPAQLKVYAGFAALAGLVLIRQSAPEAHKRTVDTVVVVSFLINVVMSGFKMDAKRRVLEGKTAGITGTVSKAWSI
jgi:uncharacterized membrane protein YozB (DUF420 family)